MLRSTINSLFIIASLPINPSIEGRVVRSSVNRDQVVKKSLMLVPQDVSYISVGLALDVIFCCCCFRW